LGHKSLAPYALDWSKVEFQLASGGNDKKVLIYDISDYQTKLSLAQLSSKKRDQMNIT